MKTSYKQKLFLYFVVIFSLFTVGVVLFEQSRERKHKTEALEEKLDIYATIVEATLKQHYNRAQVLDSLILLFPRNIRLTWIDKQGTVLYDNVIRQISKMDNHILRPEIIDAQNKGKGIDIRLSSTNEHEYLYYARQFNDYFIRVALPYNIQVKRFLKADNLFLYYIIALFLIMLVLINYVANRFSKSIKQLRDFTHIIEKGNANDCIMYFPEDELGDIGAKIAENYLHLKESKKEVTIEREKLLQHVHNSEEGICFFSANKTVEFYNGLFIKYLNIIIEEKQNEPSNTLKDISFNEVVSFLFNSENKNNYFETQINKHGKVFSVRVNIFDDKSFEIILNDISKQEKTRLLKQQMTANIAHELRTPVTGILGCLETLIANKLDPEKKRRFLENAYKQVLLLSELIQDTSLITRIDEVPHSFRLEFVTLLHLLENLKYDMAMPLQKKGIKLEWNITEKIIINGNPNLLNSIFRNLTDNVIRHAGNNISIFINKYNEDENFYYFSYSDTGVGISNEYHLNRLFERFYRVDEGRTRYTGGSGLGLSIVKNAITLHRGTVSVKNRTRGGLEFLFNLPKATLQKTEK